MHYASTSRMVRILQCLQSHLYGTEIRACFQLMRVRGLVWALLQETRHDGEGTYLDFRVCGEILTVDTVALSCAAGLVPNTPSGCTFGNSFSSSEGMVQPPAKPRMHLVFGTYRSR